MNIIIFGAAGFIGTNLILELAKKSENKIIAVDEQECFFCSEVRKFDNVEIVSRNISANIFIDDILNNQDIVYHLVSTTMPSNSNRQIECEMHANISFTTSLLESCVRNHVKRVVFISSGGTVYGKESKCPLNEEMPTKPISAYGLQKITIEQLLYLYKYIYGIDYKIVRLANPYGPYQRPNGMLGVVTTFTYKALFDEKIYVYGDGSIVRDFVYIDDAIRAIINVSYDNGKFNVFNVGSGYGISIREVISTVSMALGKTLDITYLEGRNVDVPINYLDVNRYESLYGTIQKVDLLKGILLTADFLRNKY